MYKILKTDRGDLLVPFHEYDDVFEKYKELFNLNWQHICNENYSEMYKVTEQINNLLETYMSPDDKTLVVIPECDYNTTLQGIMSKNFDVPMYVTHDEIYPNYLSISSSYIAEYYRGDAEDTNASNYACYGSEPWHAKPHLLLATGWRIISVR